MADGITTGMNYKGLHRKYIEGSSEYAVYFYGDTVERDGKTYVCSVQKTFGYLPGETGSGFDLIAFSEDPSPFTGLSGEIGGGTY